MATRATVTFEGKHWDEQPFSEIEGGPKLTKASVTNIYHGDLEGEGSLEYLMVYTTAGPVDFVGYERIVGRIGDRAGSFVLQHTGTYADGTANATYAVVPGSGTGALTGLRGQGTMAASHAPSSPFPFEYDIDE
jgi:hypothetical protein